MSQRKIELAEGEFYHIYNRGNSKQLIFKDDTDSRRFQKLLYVMNSTESMVFRLVEDKDMYIYDRGKSLVAIGAYCLMPNHFHLLVTPVVANGVQLFMQKISTGYSMYFNKRYQRTGGLFEGRFKSQHANTDEYLKYLFSYIHLNPLKLLQSDWKERGFRDIRGGRELLDTYQFSSYLDYARGNRLQSTILDMQRFPEYFPSQGTFLAQIKDWMSYQDFVAELK